MNSYYIIGTQLHKQMVYIKLSLMYKKELLTFGCVGATFPKYHKENLYVLHTSDQVHVILL